MNAMNRQVPSGEHRHPGLAFDTAHATESEPAVLTLNEVARDLRSSKAHICNIIAGRVRGLAPLAVIRLGRRILVRRSTLEEWKNRCEQGA